MTSLSPFWKTLPGQRSDQDAGAIAPPRPTLVLQPHFAYRADAIYVLACLLLSPSTGSRFKSPTIKIVRYRARFARGIAMEANMATGTVKWFNPTKGFGFIQPESGDKDVFVHISAVEKAGIASLTEGQRVSYELVTEKGRTSAGNLQAA